MNNKKVGLKRLKSINQDFGTKNNIDGLSLALSNHSNNEGY
jgi:hypothetical protein